MLPLLGHKPLTDWDEGIYAEVSREMLSGGWRAWIIPHWNGQLWFEKPPLLLWITAGFFRLFGVTEFWARAGSALSGVTIVGVLHRWVARREGYVAAWIGTVVLLSTTGFLHVCRVGEMDALLSLGCVIALIGLAAIASGLQRGWYGFWAGFAVAAMTKGSASVVLPLTLAVLAVIERWGRRRFGQEFWLGLTMWCTAVLPWHLALWHLYTAAFLREYFGFHVLSRATQAIEGHETPWWFYGKVLLVSAMPWVLLWPLAIWRAWLRTELRVWVVFTIVVAGFFSVVRTRLPHYVAPVYPAMTVLMAVFLGNAMQSVRRLAVKRQIAVLAMTATIWSGGLLATAGERRRLHSAVGTGGWTAVEEWEAVTLLWSVPQNRPVLTWWTEPRRSVAVCLFYSRRTIVQVAAAADPAAKKDRYRSDARSLNEAVGDQPVAILLETKLLPAMPSDFVYTRTKAGPTMEIGMIQRQAGAVLRRH